MSGRQMDTNTWEKQADCKPISKPKNFNFYLNPLLTYYYEET